MTFKEHVERWKDCQDCPLCSQRSRIVLARGQLPCDVLFLGEAPGDSEDSIGAPFKGPAGKLLDRIIVDAFALQLGADRLRVAFTNLVACFPKIAKREGVNEPTSDEIRACQPRLKEFVRIAKPRMIVLVGKLTKKWVSGQSQFSDKGENDHPPWIRNGEFMRFVEINHPAYILRANIAQQGLLIQRATVQIANAVEGL